MQAVLLVELGIEHHAFKEEGIENEPMLLGEGREDGVEVVRVGIAPVRRRAHAHEQDRELALLQFGKDLLQVIARHLRIDAAQRVVGAELQNDGVDIVADGPVEAGKPRGGRVAGNAAVRDDDGVAAPLERFLKLVRKGVLRADAIAGGEAVAEGQDANRFLARG